jgi:hypothetical protein
VKRPDIETAKEEAFRFIERADKVLNSQAGRDGHPIWEAEYGKQTGALRRASMDLTRALADVRRR